MSEFVGGFDFAPMVGIFARAGTPATILQKIAAAALVAANDPEVVAKLAAIGVEAAGAGPEEFRRALEGESTRVEAAVRAAGLKSQ